MSSTREAADDEFTRPIRWFRLLSRFAPLQMPPTSYLGSGLTLRLVDGLTIAFLCCLGLVGATRVLFLSTGVWQAILGIGYVTALVGMQVILTEDLARRPRPRHTSLILLAQAALVYLPLLQFTWWLGLHEILAGTLLLVLRPALSIPLFVGVVGSVAWAQLELEAGSLLAVVCGVTSTAATGLAIYGLTRLAGLTRQLYMARDEAARLAIAEERLRFTRQLHKLAVQLSAIVAQVERVRERLGHRTPRAGAGLEEVLAISRKALADARSVANCHQRLSLASELASAHSVLTAAGVEVTIERASPIWVGRTGTILATVLREGATNVLRHGQARQCRITLCEAAGMARIEMMNDGVVNGTELDDGVASRIEVLARRVEQCGGTVQLGPQPDGCHLLRAAVPLDLRDELADAHAMAEAAGRAQAARLGHQLASVIITIFVVCLCLIALTEMLTTKAEAWQMSADVVVLTVILTLQLGYFGRPDVRFRAVTAVPLLLLQAALVYALLVPFGKWWMETLPAFVAANILLVFRQAIALPPSVLVVATCMWLRPVLGGGDYQITSTIFETASVAILVFGLAWFVRLAHESHVSSDRLTQVAVAEERLRFARDLHDLLGLSMSAITIKTSLASKLFEPHPDSARKELAEIVELCRKTLGDVRLVADGYLELSLDEELSLARSVLASAEIRAKIVRNDRNLPEPVELVLAMVVREGTTNVLRHSRAEWCAITLQQTRHLARLEIVNDGVASPAAGSGSTGGSGVCNLSHRIAAVGGECLAGVDGHGLYRLSATIPLSA